MNREAAATGALGRPDGLAMLRAMQAAQGGFLIGELHASVL